MGVNSSEEKTPVNFITPQTIFKHKNKRFIVGSEEKIG